MRTMLITMMGCGVLCSCGMTLPDVPPPLSTLQPQLASLDPSPLRALATREQIQVLLTRPVVAAQVTTRTVGVVAPATDDASDAEVLTQFEHAENTVPIAVAVADEQTTIAVTPMAVWPDQGVLAVVITDAVASPEGVPVGDGSGTGMVLRYAVNDAVASEVTGVAPMVESAAAPSVAVPRADCLLSELLYDVPGSDTNGDVFVELSCVPGTDAGGWSVQLVNGDDGAIYATLKIPAATIVPGTGVLLIADAINGNSAVSHVPGAQVVLNFDPQNGPDSVRILDADDALADVVGYGGAAPLTSDAQGVPLVRGDAVPKLSAGQSLSRIALTPGANNHVEFIVGVPSPGVR